MSQYLNSFWWVNAAIWLVIIPAELLGLWLLDRHLNPRRPR